MFNLHLQIHTLDPTESETSSNKFTWSSEITLDLILKMWVIVDLTFLCTKQVLKPSLPTHF